MNIHLGFTLALRLEADDTVNRWLQLSRIPVIHAYFTRERLRPSGWVGMDELAIGGVSMASISKYASGSAIRPQTGIGASRSKGAEHEPCRSHNKGNRPDATGIG